MMFGQLVLLCLCAAAWAAKVKLDDDFISEVVARHNELRALHGAKPVKANRKVSKYAQRWANYLEKKGKFEHRSTNKYGENLSWMSGSPTGADHVNNLYVEEEKYYSDNGLYGTEPSMTNFASFGHFTQIVWKKCKKIGVGKAGNIVVINYKPYGNVVGSFKENVPSKVETK